MDQIQYLKNLEQNYTNSSALDGNTANLIHLVNANGMTISLMDIGATWLSCTLPINNGIREVLLRSPNMLEHNKHTAYLGATVGRFANRIAKGKFEIDGIQYQLDINNGENALHGGLKGFDKRRWIIEDKSQQHVIFSLFSEDGDQGYPGNLEVSVTFTLTDDNAVNIEYHANTDKKSPVNFTNHAYFNLAGIDSNISVLEHSLQINAKHYLPTTETMIPTGELKPVQNTSFDFTQTKIIGRDFLTDADQKIASGYDHSFIFAKEITNAKNIVATLISPSQDVRMHIKTTKPAMQLYTGNFLKGNQGVGKKIENHDGLALETQYFPDSPNQKQLCQDYGINCIYLEPEVAYYHQTIYLFEF